MELENNKIINKKKETITAFEDIKHIDTKGNEYWNARELMIVLEYSKWENFHKVIRRSIVACENSNYNIVECFPKVRKTSKVLGGIVRIIKER